MIVVTGASGKLGRLIVTDLLKRVPAETVGISVRDPAKATDLADAGVRVRVGDFARAETLSGAFEGATQVLLISSNAEAYGGDTLAQHRAAIEAARGAGVRRIVYTSHMGSSPTSQFSPMHNHAATEAMLAECGVAWTALRNGFYADSAAAIILGDVQASKKIVAPADGKVSWTAHEDLASAAAAILCDESRFDGPTPPLTAAEAVDLADLARISGDLIGTPVERHVIEDEAFRRNAIEHGVPEVYAALRLGTFRAARDGEFAAVDPTLAELIGRPPITMREILANKFDR